MIVNSYKTGVQIYCQDRFFTDLISTRGQGVRGWPSGKTEMLHSVVMLPKRYEGRPRVYMESPRVNSQRPSTCTRTEMESAKENRCEVSYSIFELKLQQTEYLSIYTK